MSLLQQAWFKATTSKKERLSEFVMLQQKHMLDVKFSINIYFYHLFLSVRLLLLKFNFRIKLGFFLFFTP